MKKMYTNFLLLLLLTLAAIDLPAQIKVVPDNYFVSPGARRMLDVMKNDNPGNCASTPEDLVLEITNPSSLPATLLNLEVTADNTILFRSRSDFQGQIKITYKITCQNGGASSTGDAYVNVGNKPDFINDAECTVESQPFVWDVEKKVQSSLSHRVQSYALPFAGDIDADGVLELITLNFKTSSYYSDSILIFNNDLSLKNAIGVPVSQTYVTLPLAIADIDADGEGEIIYGTGWQGDGHPLNYVLQAYRWDGTMIWQSSTSYIENIVSTIFHSSAISIADLDGDGTVEILCGDRVFAGESGALLATLPSGGGRGRQQWASSGNTHGYLPAIGDIDGDGILEIAAGNTTYRINIVSRNNPALNSVTTVASLPQIVGTTLTYTGADADGYTSLADIDGDGILDVVVIAKPTSSSGPCILYVWQGSGTQFIGNIIQNGTKGSRPFIGDITGDGRADIAFTRTGAFDAYEYNSNTNSFDLLFTVPTSDGSGATTMSMFDFNLDGEVELVYRDETLLRIIDKDGNNVKDDDGNEAVFACTSGTHTEYPIVVDLDGDGHAEIIVSGGDPSDYSFSGGVNANCRLMVFGSKTEGTWAPARRVWNQHGYNPLYINEDLSVPEKPLSPTTKIAHKDGTVHTPFNSYLQQSGVLNTEGESLNLSPDLSFQVGKNQKMYHNPDTDELEVTAYITNSGSLDFSGDIKLSLYLFDKTAGTYHLQGSQVFTAQTLAQRNNKTLTFKVSNYSSIVFPAEYLWYVVLNLDENGTSAPSGAYNDQRECNYWNNLTSRMSYISGQIILCKDEEATLNIEPQGAFDCYWYKADGTPFLGAGGTDSSNKGDSKTVKKLTEDYKEYFLIDVYQKNTASKITAAPDTVFMYNSPDSLVWTGAFDSDWNNILNWSSPDDPAQEKLFSYIPRGCTNVHIPDQMSIYPDLSSSGTSYDIYANAACNNITFEHGAEVLNSDLLSYSKAYVQLELMSNRWYCFSPPLRHFYSGDIYLTDANPYLDNMFAYTRRFLQTSKPGYIEGYWGRTFTNPNVLLTAGDGIGLWIDDLDPNPNNHQPMQFNFPKYDNEHFLYDEDGSEQPDGPFLTSRTYSNRLIFEETINTSTKNVSLMPLSTQAGVDILVGNPFMSHLDFKKFYNYGNNKDLIEDHYRIMDADGNYATYSISGTSTGNPVLTNLISPMQAILVTPKKAFAANSLLAHPSLTQNSPGNKLRSAVETFDNNQDPEFIRIYISDTNIRNRCALVYNHSVDSGNSFSADQDIYKVLRMGDKNPNVYLITEEGYYMDIKTISAHNNLEIPIGICGEMSGSMSLGFERLWDFAPEYGIYLVDKKENKEVNLRLSSIYTFNATNTSDSFINNRFAFRFSRSTTSIENEKEAEEGITYSITNNELNLSSKSNSDLSSVFVYDLQGRLLVHRENIHSPSVQIGLDNGIYIVKAGTQDQFKSFKITVN